MIATLYIGPMPVCPSFGMAAEMQIHAEDADYEEIEENTKDNDYELDKEMVDLLP